MKRTASIAIAALVGLVAPGLSEARVRSNTMVRLPKNLYLADMNGDQIDDWISVDDRDVFVARTSFQAQGYTFRRLESPVLRVVTGHFSSTSKETACFILNNGKLMCFGLSPDTTALWWAWTQGTFIGASDHAIVGDYTGDGLDDILVYRPSAGTFKLYSKGSQGWFVELGSDKFDIGNLADASKLKYKTVLAGNFADFSGEGSRTDLLIYDPSLRRVMRYDARRNQQGKTTFWWAFTTNNYVVSADEEVTVASITGGAFENVVLHNKKTGAFRFKKMQYSRGNLASLWQEQGQLKVAANTQLFWGDFKHHPTEAGYTESRDDAIVYDPSWNGIHLAVARWSGTSKTYWWAYSQQLLVPDWDQDGDGITTRYELGGLDADGDGDSDEPLHQYGASPFAKDIFVEVDYMRRASPVKDLRMKLEAQNLAIAEMAKHGINLHIMQDDEIPFQADLKGGDKDFSWEKHFDPIKDEYFTPTRWGLFHYAVFANSFDDDVSGISRGIPGSDFLVTLGLWSSLVGTVDEQAGTFLHELGHNINLSHGGVDGWNYKPNHLSIMNYNYQTVGIWKDGSRQFLYHEIDCQDLDENQLNEKLGVRCTVPGGTTYKTWVNSMRSWQDLNVNINFDQDGNGQETSVKVNISNDKVEATGQPIFTLLKGASNEYSRMMLKVGLIGQNMPAGVTASGDSAQTVAVKRSQLVRNLMPVPSPSIAREELTFRREKVLRSLRPPLPALDTSTLRTPIKKFQVLSSALVIPSRKQVSVDIARVQDLVPVGARTLTAPVRSTVAPAVPRSPIRRAPTAPSPSR